MSNEEHSILPILFLGAGASAKAEVPTTRRFVKEFREHLEKTQSEMSPAEFEPFFDALEEPDDDVEALLELLHQYRELDGKPIGKMVERKVSVDPTRAERLLELLEGFIHKTCYVSKERVDYLEPLLSLLEAYGRPLDIFTVNYDTSIEVYCFTHGLEFNNGFQRTWAPRSLMQPEAGIDINIFKLHGSATWWLTDEGRPVEIPLEMEATDTTTYYGSRARSLVVYPYDPRKKAPISTQDLLPMLRERLENTNLAVVVGYSFRDPDIREIFLDAARKNEDLKMVFIGPRAYEIYQDELSGREEGVSSPLRGFVLCLPYLFEKVFPTLRQDHLVPFVTAWSRLKERKWAEMVSTEQVFYTKQWEHIVSEFSKAGDFEKVVEIVARTSLGEWGTKFLLEVAPTVYVAAALCGADEEKEIGSWLSRLFDDLGSGIKLTAQKTDGDAEKWSGGISLSFPNMDEFQVRFGLATKLREKEKMMKHLTDMAEKKMVTSTVRSVIHGVGAIAEYLEERWPRPDYLPVVDLVSDGCRRDESRWKRLLKPIQTGGEWRPPTLLQEFETAEKETFRRHIQEYWPETEDEKQARH